MTRKAKAMNKDKSAEAPKKRGKAKKLLLISTAALALVGAGVGAGVYASGMLGAGVNHEDSNRPKLVERVDHASDTAEAGGHGDGPPPLKVGTVTVKSDMQRIDAKKFEVTYFPVEQAFTANLADGSGFVQVGLSLATYYDGGVIANLQRQMVPIRSAILMVLSDQDAAIISTPDGKKMLQKRLTQSINTVLREKEGFGGIDNVYFTNLVIQ
jgi:flagellar protein FliL